MEHTATDDQFFIEEATHQWTIANDLKIWTNNDWEMDADARFPLQMLANHWHIQPENDENAMIISQATNEDDTSSKEGSSNRPALKRRSVQEEDDSSSSANINPMQVAEALRAHS